MATRNVIHPSIHLFTHLPFFGIPPPNLIPHTICDYIFLYTILFIHLLHYVTQPTTSLPATSLSDDFNSISIMYNCQHIYSSGNNNKKKDYSFSLYFSLYVWHHHHRHLHSSHTLFLTLESQFFCMSPHTPQQVILYFFLNFRVFLEKTRRDMKCWNGKKGK